MSEAIDLRTMWKEYRQQRAFWLATFVGGVLFQTLLVVGGLLARGAPEPYLLFAIALGMPALYALGSGALLFAGEHDADTYDFQRALPIDWKSLVVAKLGFSLASACILMPLLWATALVFAGGRLPPLADHRLLWTGSIVAVAEVFAWSVLFSLLIHNLARP